MRDYKNVKVTDPLSAIQLLQGAAFCAVFCGLILLILLMGV